MSRRLFHLWHYDGNYPGYLDISDDGRRLWVRTAYGKRGPVQLKKGDDPDATAARLFGEILDEFKAIPTP